MRHVAQLRTSHTGLRQHSQLLGGLGVLSEMQGWIKSSPSPAPRGESSAQLAAGGFVQLLAALWPQPTSNPPAGSLAARPLPVWPVQPLLLLGRDETKLARGRQAAGDPAEGSLRCPCSATH